MAAECSATTRLNGLTGQRGAQVRDEHGEVRQGELVREERVGCRPSLAVGETVILLHHHLPSVCVLIGMGRGCQQNDSVADG